MKILNLYAGIGGNRKYWTPNGNEHKITAVELDSKIAEIYQNFFPNDNIIVADAHQYLLDHYKEFDFIWASPPCPTHSRLNKSNCVGLTEKKYPDMSLYQEIIFLQHWYKGKWCVENVISYYEPLITPYEIAKHYFWTNYFIRELPKGERGHTQNISGLEKIKGFELKYFGGIDKRKALRNCVEPETGLWVFQEAFKQQPTLI